MRRAVVVAVAWIAALAAGAGCNAIVGNSDHELALDATATPDDGAAISDAAAVEDAGPKVDAGGSKPDSGECTSGAKQCSGETPQTCNSAGHWVNGTPCKYVCSAGTCTGTCVPTTMQTCGDAGSCSSLHTCGSTGEWGPCMSGSSTCVPAPAGWVAVAIAAAADAGCPTGFGLPAAVVANPQAGAVTCACNCQGTQLCTGSAVLSEYVSGTCAGTPDQQAQATFSSECGGGGGVIAMGDGYLLTEAGVAPGPNCQTTVQATSTPAVTTDTVVVCHAAATCSNGACLSSTANMCVQQGGTVACPPGFPKRTLVAFDVTDARGCGPCACGSTLTCALNGVLFDNDYTCATNNPYNFTLKSACVTSPSSFPLNRVQALVTASGDGGCAQTAPSLPIPGAGVTLDPQRTYTICCP